MKKKKIIAFFTIVASILAIIYARSEFESVYQSLRQVNARVIALAGALQVITVLIINYQWKYLASTINSDVSYMEIFDMNMVGTFVESITPSAKAGGEASKVYVLANNVGLSISQATSLVGIQKINSMLAFLIINFLSIAWFVVKVRVDGNSLKLMMAGLITMVLVLGVGILILLSKCFSNFILERLPLKSEKKESLGAGFENIRSNFNKSVANRERFLKGFSMSFVIWSLFAFKAYIISRGIGMELGFSSTAVATFLTYMVGMLPLTPGGVGTFEASMILFMTPLGVSVSEGLLLSLTLRFVTFWLVFLASAVYLAIKNLRQLLLKKQRVC